MKKLTAHLVQPGNSLGIPIAIKVNGKYCNEIALHSGLYNCCPYGGNGWCNLFLTTRFEKRALRRKEKYPFMIFRCPQCLEVFGE